MSVINETVRLLIDSTISCSVSPQELIIRGLALIGLVNISSSIISGLATSVAYPIVYLWGFIKWAYNKFRGKTI